MTEKLTYDPTPADAPELSEDEQNSLEVADKLQQEEAELLAGKFKNAEDLENAYLELQKKLGSDESQPDEKEKPETTITEDNTYNEDGTVNYESVNEQYGDKLGALFQENNVDPWEISKHFHETKGEITDEMYKTLEDTGLSRASIDSYLAGRAAESGYTTSQQADLTDAEVTKIQTSVGGEAQYNKMIGWASENLEPTTLEAFNSMIGNGDFNTVQLAVNGLKAQYENAEGYEGKMLTGKPAKSSGDVFRSQSEVVQAMSDLRYDRDPAYRQDVFDKLERSNLQF
tara:strand:- start:14 stop:871 length:858 start_codon:yes stop_codon:yes gene_type:complete